MKRIFLASSASHVAMEIGRRLADSMPLALLYVTTAAEVEEGDLWWLRADRQALVEAGFSVTDYTITGKGREQIAADFARAGAICFSGGNNFHLLQQIQRSDCAGVVLRLVDEGKPYIGISAGAIVAAPDIELLYFEPHARLAPGLAGFRGMGLVDVLVFPHWGNPFFKDFYLQHRLEGAYATGHKIILLTDQQFVLATGEAYQIIEVKK